VQGDEHISSTNNKNYKKKNHLLPIVLIPLPQTPSAGKKTGAGRVSATRLDLLRGSGEEKKGFNLEEKSVKSRKDSKF